MSNSSVDVANQSVQFDGKVYKIQELGPDHFAVLVDGVPVGRIVYSWGTANGVAESDSIDEETVTAIAEAWFSATEAS